MNRLWDALMCKLGRHVWIMRHKLTYEVVDFTRIECWYHCIRCGHVHVRTTDHG